MRAQAQILEIVNNLFKVPNSILFDFKVGDLRHADDVPPENVLFVCKLNPVTTDEDLEIIFARFNSSFNLARHII